MDEGIRMDSRCVTELIKENVSYSREGNVFRFIEDEENRPEWSQVLNRYFYRESFE